MIRSNKIGVFQQPVSTNLGTLFLVPFFEILTNQIPDESFRKAFDVVALAEPTKLENAVLTIHQIEAQMLLRWLLSGERAKVPSTVEALVIDRLLEANNNLEPNQIDLVRARLLNFVRGTGVPLAVYMLHAKTGLSEVIPRMQLLADDPTVDLTLKRMLFKKFANDLRGLDIDRLAVPDKDKERFRKWLRPNEDR